MKWQETKDSCLSLLQCQLYEAHSPKTHRLLSDLESEIEYLSDEASRVRVYGKWHSVPRRVAGYGDEGVVYTYSSSQLKAQEWTPTLQLIREDIEGAMDNGVKFNFVLVNRYENGMNHMGFHRDDEKELDKSAPIASLSLGATRDFVLKPRSDVKAEKQRINMSLSDGSLLLMLEPTNQHWMHSLPQRRRCRQPRINLTFRKVHVSST